MGSFTAKKRTSYLEELSKCELDLLIIGGGITGAGIALDAALRGLEVGLVEMQDFAAGTSSRSTKLVHGGLRYLKQLELKLVSEVGKERAIVYENAPHVTTPEWMLLPIMKGGTFGKISTSIGLKVYDMLARVKKKERRKMLTKKEALKREPLLRKDILKGAGLYVEYRTDDARLTLEVLKTAVARGVRAVNYAKAQRFAYKKKQVVGAEVIDVLSGKSYQIKARKIVNATGPWVDTLRERDQSKRGKYLKLTKGVHIVVDKSKFPLKQAIYFDTEDGRMIFAIPREGKTYIGTTDTFYDHDLDCPRTRAEDVDYLIKAVRYQFPSVTLKPSDVESNWAGLRPLIHEEGKGASDISRKDEIFISPSGLISIAGGKLTGYRKMAERVVDTVVEELGMETKSTTKKAVLSGGEIGGSNGFSHFITRQMKAAAEIGLTEKEGQKLASLYGSNICRVFEIIKEEGWKGRAYGLTPVLYGMLRYSMEEEMTCTPLDFFIRRTGALYFEIDWVKNWQDPVLHFMKRELSWSEAQKEKHKEQLKQELYFACNPIK